MEFENSKVPVNVIYHGSPNIVKSPTFGFGKTANDYGRGFYCTPFANLGKEWAVKYDGDGFLNQYNIDMSGLKILNLEDPSYTILHWLTILLKYRYFSLRHVESKEAKEYLLTHFSIPEEDQYDIITGYRADDSFFMYAEDFLNRDLPYAELKKSIQLGGLGTQVVLKSKIAFQRLQFVDASIVLKEEWYQKYQERDSSARSEYKEKTKSRKRSSFDIDHIVQEGVKPNDPRLR